MKLDRMLVIIVILSLAVSIYTIYQRFEVEKPYNRVELVADYDGYKNLAGRMGMDIEDIFKKLKEAGVTSVAIKEETVRKLQESGMIAAVPLWELKSQAIIKGEQHPAIEEIINSSLDPSTTTVIFTEDLEVYNRIREPLKLRSRGFYDWSRDGLYAISVSGRYADLENLALGFDYGKFKMAKRLGLNIAAQPSNFNGISPEYIEGLFAMLERYPVTSLIFDGKQVLGYPDNLEVTARMVEETGIVIGPIETWMQLKHVDQKGIEQLIKLTDYKAVRVFSLNESEASKVSPKEIMDRWFRAVCERNLRLVYLKPKIEDFKSPEENFETNRFYINRFASMITDRGFILGPVRPMRNFSIGSLRLLFLAAGVISGGALLLMNLFEMKKAYIYWIFVLGMIVSAAVRYLIPSLADKGFALGAALVFPSLAMVYTLCYCKGVLKGEEEKRWAHIMGKSVLVLIKASAISLVGAAYVASLLSSTPYLLEMDIFRGVKVAHVIPLGLFVIAYVGIIGYRRHEHKGLVDEIKALLNIPISVKYVVLFSIVIFAGYVYLGRTGHASGAPVFDFEVRLRTFLEQTLTARPRTKEFLIAHPAFILMIAGTLKGYRRVILSMGLVATVGQISIVNTFSHLKAPLYISFYRTLYGLGLGIALGIIGIIFLVVAVYVLKPGTGLKNRL